MYVAFNTQTCIYIYLLSDYCYRHHCHDHYQFVVASVTLNHYNLTNRPKNANKFKWSLFQNWILLVYLSWDYCSIISFFKCGRGIIWRVRWRKFKTKAPAKQRRHTQNSWWNSEKLRPWKRAWWKLIPGRKDLCHPESGLEPIHFDF